jgi:hypothetical protein
MWLWHWLRSIASPKKWQPHKLLYKKEKNVNTIYIKFFLTNNNYVGVGECGESVWRVGIVGEGVTFAQE